MGRRFEPYVKARKSYELSGRKIAIWLDANKFNGGLIHRFRAWAAMHLLSPFYDTEKDNSERAE